MMSEVVDFAAGKEYLMKKYKTFGKKILAVAVALATVLTTASIDPKVFAATEIGGASISSGGYIGQIVSNTNSTYQEATEASFDFYAAASGMYSYTAYIYQNPTSQDDPTSGVLRKTINGSVIGDADAGSKTVTLDIATGDDSKPIVLSGNETLGVAVQIISLAGGSDIQYGYDTDGKGGLIRQSSSAGWTKPYVTMADPDAKIIDVAFDSYTGTVDDVTSITIDPESVVLSVGDADVDLNVNYAPAYKRDILLSSGNTGVITISGDNAKIVSSGKADITASFGSVTTSKSFYVLENSLDKSTYDYTGSQIKPAVTVKCGTDTLTENTDYSLSYGANTNPGNNAGSVTISGRNSSYGNLSGYSRTLYFDIEKGKITQDQVDGAVFGIDTATSEVTSATVGSLTLGEDYTATATLTRTDLANNKLYYNIVVNAKGNYVTETGAPLIRNNYEVTGGSSSKIDINGVVEARLDEDEYYYTGSDVKPQVEFYNINTGDKIDLFSNNCVISYPTDMSSASEDEPKVITIRGDESRGYTGEMTLEYYLLPYDISDSNNNVNITIAEEQSGKGAIWTHTGNPITPRVTATYTIDGVTRTLAENSDIEIEYSANTNVGTATITISGTGNFTGTVQRQFTIIADFERDASVKIGGYEANYSNGFASAYTTTYDGNQKRPQVSGFKLNGKSSRDFEYVYGENKNAGTGTVIIKGKSGTVYEGKEFTATFTITPKNLANGGFLSVNQAVHIYSGDAISLSSGEYTLYDGASLLVEGADYDISFSNNVNAGTALITATGKGNYTGTAGGTYTISALDIADSSITVNSISPQPYTGSRLTPDVTITRNGATIDSSNYTLSYADNTDVGTATVTITGRNNYSGSRTTTFTISPKSLEGLVYTVGGLPTSGSGTSYVAEYTAKYNGAQIKPAVSVFDNGMEVSSSNYNIIYVGCINAGDNNYILLQGKGAYAGSSVSIRFTIDKRSIKRVSEGGDTQIALNGSKRQIYQDESYYVPIVTITDPTAQSGKNTLSEGVDYEIIPDANATDAGPSYEATIRGLGNYEGTETTIDYGGGTDITGGIISEMTMPDGTKISADSTSYEYIGSLRPSIKAFINGTEIATSGYDVAFSDVYNANQTVTITVTGKGDYYGTITREMLITPKSIEGLNFADTNNWNYTYNRRTIAVNPTVTYHVNDATDLTLAKGTDFLINNKADDTIGPDQGSYTVTFTGRGNYTGSKTQTIVINPYNITSSSDISIEPSEIANQQYTGSEIRPQISLRHKLNDTTTETILPENGYELEYTDNVDVSTDSSKAKITITGNNNYTGQRTVEFSIVKRVLTSDNTSVTGIGEMVYDNTEKKPTFHVFYEGRELTSDNYDVAYYDNVKVGKGEVTSSGESGPRIAITGKGLYEGTVYVPFTIKGNLASEYFRLDGLSDTYNITGGDISVDAYQVQYKYTDPSDPTKESWENIADTTQYELIKPTTIFPGESSLRVRGSGDLLYGSATKDITLKGSLNDAVINGIEEIYSYTGNKIEPEPTVTYNGYTLTEGSDIKVTYQSNTNVGTATVKVEPAGSDSYFTSSKSVTFKIRYNLSAATISDYESSYDYTGSEITPTPTVKIGDTVLDPSSDYEVTYNNNVNAGVATMTINAKGDKTFGSKTVTYRINQLSLSNETCNVEVQGAPFKYTGRTIQPEVIVTYTSGGGKTLTAGVDYTINYPSDSVIPGDYTLSIRGIGNYTGTISGNYKINPAEMSSDVVITVPDAYYAGGWPVIPKYTITYEGMSLTEGVDFTYTASGNTNVTDGKTASITFKAIDGGNYKFEKTENFAVIPTDVGTGTVTVSGTSSEYTGFAINPDIEVTIDTGVKDDSGDPIIYTLQRGDDTDQKDYTVTYNGSGDMIDAGSYSIRIEGHGNFIGSQNVTYTVTPKSLSDASIDIVYTESWDYTGSEIEPPIYIYDSNRAGDDGNKLLLTEGVDYTLTYINNIASASKDGENPPTIRVVGIGNYSGVVDNTFNIGTEIEDTDVALAQNNYTYDAMVHTPDANVIVGGVSLSEGADYNIVYTNSDGTQVDANAGAKIATITGTGAYYGTVSKTYNVKKKDTISERILIVPRDLSRDALGYYTTYTGDYIEPEIDVYDSEISTEIPLDTSSYTVTYEHNKEMSTTDNPAIIKITLGGNYSDASNTYQLPFRINAKTIDSDFNASIKGETTSFTYTGQPVEPEVTVEPSTPAMKDTTLIEGVDYYLTYTNNVNAGRAAVTVTGMGNYSGAIVLPYNIVADLSTAVITAEDQFYTGGEVYAPLTVICGGNTLTEGVDYEVIYTSDDNWEYTGRAHLTASASQAYSGSVDKTYNIVFDPSLLTVSNYDKQYTYTGKAIEPDFVITAPNGDVISYDKSAVTHFNSSTRSDDTTSIGTVTASIPVTIGSKTTTVTATYDIVSKSIIRCEITPLNDNVYTGKSIYPPVIIKDRSNNYRLVEGKDYTLEYSNNINPGVGRVTITGLGEYAGVMTAVFNIIAPNVLGLTSSSDDENTVTLRWLRNAHVSGYEIYSADQSIKYGTSTSNTYTVSSLKAGADYTFSVRSYIRVGNKTTYGEFATVDAHTGISEATISGASYARKRATINWTGDTNVSGYEIYRAVSENGTFNKIAVMPATAGGYSDSSLNSGATYYYKVRAYQKVGENNFIYGKFSDTIPITIR